jgi:pilus assembly protein CpaB
MDRTRLLVVWFLALALGMFVSRQMYRTVQSKTASPKAVDVVVATHDIGVGTKIDDKDIEVVRFPAALLPPNCFHQKSSVVGRGVVLPLANGEFVQPNKLAGENAGSGMTTFIPPGMRAVSARVNGVIFVLAFVQPGTRVDVLLTNNASGTTAEEATIVLENVAVIATGQELDRSSSGEPRNAPVITFLVSPDDARKLTQASSHGRIELILRHPQQEQHKMRDTPLKPILPGAPLSPRLSRLMKSHY